MALYVCDAIEKTLYEVGLDGSNPTVLWTSTFAPYWPVYDAETNKFFFTGSADVYSINHDGSDEIKLVDPGSDAISSIGIDHINKKIYYGIRNDNEIRRCDFNGGDDGVVLTPTEPGGVQIDIAGGKCYWTKESPGQIYRDTIPGGGNEELLLTDAASKIEQFNLDLVNSKIYWCDSIQDLICRCNLDGSDKETIIISSASAWGCAVDGSGGKIYWTETVPNNVKRANLDGSDPETIWSGSLFPAYLHVVSEEKSTAISGTSILFTCSQILTSETGKGTLRIIHRLARMGDHHPQLIGSFDSGLSSVNIQIWDVVDGINTPVTIANSGCYIIGDTGKWGWSTEYLPLVSGYHNYHYYFKMISNINSTDYGEFFLTVPECSRWIYP